MYRIEISKDALFDLERIDPKNAVRILKKVNYCLQKNPFPRGKNPKKLQGINAFRLRFGDYRIIYKVSSNTVFIYAISHRKDIYKRKN